MLFSIQVHFYSQTHQEKHHINSKSLDVLIRFLLPKLTIFFAHKCSNHCQFLIRWIMTQAWRHFCQGMQNTEDQTTIIVPKTKDPLNIHKYCIIQTNQCNISKVLPNETVPCQMFKNIACNFTKTLASLCKHRWQQQQR